MAVQLRAFLFIYQPVWVSLPEVLERNSDALRQALCHEALVAAVQSVVKGLRAPTRETILPLAAELASVPDRSAFAQMLTDALNGLHEGSVARYRLKCLEYIAWQAIRSVG